MKNKVEVLCHSSIKVTGSKIIYIDPFRINKNYNDADYIFCTHSHYDHFSKEDIEKVIKEDTVIVTVESSKEETIDIVKDEKRVVIVCPNNHYKIDEIEFETTYAYNVNKAFHPKENNWVRVYYKIGWRKLLYCRRHRQYKGNTKCKMRCGIYPSSVELIQ